MPYSNVLLQILELKSMKTTKLRTALEYILVICIIIEFNTPYTVFSVANRVIQMLPIFILLILIMLSRYSVTKKINAYILLYLTGAIFPILVINEQAYLSYILRFIIILPLLWIYLYLRKETGLLQYLSVFIKYSNIVIIIAITSLIMWLLCSILHIIPITAIIPYDWAPNVDYIPTYWGIYFETQGVAPLGERIWRNTGIFNEGPMYNMVLCVAFAIEYFIRPIKSKIRLWVLAITIFTTFTTTGQLFLIGFTGWHIYKKISRKKYHLLLIIVIPLLFLGGYYAIDKILENKVETKGGENSVNDRTEDIMVCLEVGMEHPLLGIGLIKTKEDQLLWKGKQFGFSNSLFYTFASGGLYSLILYIGALVIIPYSYYRKYKNTQWLFTMLCYFFIFSITISVLKYLTLLFLAWGLSNLDLKRWKLSNTKKGIEKLDNSKYNHILNKRHE